MNLTIQDLPSASWKSFSSMARPLVLAVMALTSCTSSTMSTGSLSVGSPTLTLQSLQVTPPSPDPRVGLRAGLFNAEEAAWNMRIVSTTPPPEEFVGITNSDLAFKGNYAIQGNYSGVQVWDISNPSNPTTVTTFVCPASQSDVSVFGNLMFVSGEGMTGRLDCSDEGVQEAVSHDRMRGIPSLTSQTSVIRTILPMFRPVVAHIPTRFLRIPTTKITFISMCPVLLQFAQRKSWLVAQMRCLVTTPTLLCLGSK